MWETLIQKSNLFTKDIIMAKELINFSFDKFQQYSLFFFSKSSMNHVNATMQKMFRTNIFCKRKPLNFWEWIN